MYTKLDQDKDEAIRTVAQAEAAVEELVQARARVLSNLSPAALRHVPAICKRRTTEAKKAARAEARKQLEEGAQ